ncbi:non-structural protein [Belmont virus]|nr:non-structural protein [Belmont virus]
MMLLNGVLVLLIQKQGMWHLQINIEGNLHMILLEHFSSSRRRPRLLSVNRRRRLSQLVFQGSHLMWLITIIHRTQRLLCQTIPIPSIGSQDTLLDG